MNYSEIFKNESLAKINQIRRNGRYESKHWYFNCLSSGRISGLYNYVLSVRYCIACLVNLLLISMGRRISPDNTFFFVNVRNLSFNKSGYSPARIGLYNIRYRQYPHIYAVIPFFGMLSCVFLAVPECFKLRRDLGNLAKEFGISNKKMISITGNLYLRTLDCLLAERSLQMVGKLSTSGHFDVYTTIASCLRRKRVVDYYSGVQHGLYEVFFAGQPCKLFFDRYDFLFEDSREYALESLIDANVVGCFRVGPKGLNLIKCSYSDKKKKIIAFGFQNDNIEEDLALLDVFYKALDRKRFILIAYLHPQTGLEVVKGIKKSYPSAHVEIKDRFSNVDLVVTRYSTLGVDYALLGVKVIFNLEVDRVCLERSRRDNIHIVYSKNDALVTASSCLSGGTDL